MWLKLEAAGLTGRSTWSDSVPVAFVSVIGFGKRVRRPV
jgi:hypothetical protein